MTDERRAIGILREISTVALHEGNAEVLLDRVLKILSNQMGMRRVTFTLRHGDVFTIEISGDLDDTEKRRGRYHFGEGITGRVAATGQPALIPDISADPRFLNRTGSHQTGERAAFLCVPVTYHEGVVGTLSGERTISMSDGDASGTSDISAKEISESELRADLELLEIIGNLTAEAVALRRAQQDERQQLTVENERLRRLVHGSGGNPGRLIGNCRNIQVVCQLIRQVAPTDATVLIRGSTGTGKELVAKAIVELSDRHEGPFVSLNCAAIPETLLESELFGHEKGAFTDASSRRIGRVEAAGGGTLFLDEIGDLNLASQVKLLRFLQERTFSRIGSNAELRADVRIIAATSCDLETLIREKRFREDLYYRINVFPIHVPDLRQRKCDIILLAEHFIEKYNLRHNRTIKKLSTPAVNLLMNYDWPGNVRELENCIERAVLTASGDSIRSYNLPPSLQGNSGRDGMDFPHYGESDEPEPGMLSGEIPSALIPDSGDFRTLVNAFERRILTAALQRHQGNMSAAARSLGLSPRVMHYQIHRLNIVPDHPDTETTETNAPG
ncbi:MAG: sigma 54-interacting transcriptional regulator [Planctomycetia bacterium]|nr:sigma 54-interacting transcriptional regulator [Planctomycetia bacterium]